ncbi:MAG TPA: hypothetical protein VMI54_08720 [Polyangiaceae bacterium]|nr:hypothetical protein [Polyangiaceae bacterium]
MRVKGMVQVSGSTYRVVRVQFGTYDVIRLLDDSRVGRFHTVPSARIESTTIGEDLMNEIARAAIQGAKTSWVGRLSIA